MKMGLLQSTAGAGDLTCWATNDSDPHSSAATEWTSGVAHWGLTSSTGLETALPLSTSSKMGMESLCALW